MNVSCKDDTFAQNSKNILEKIIKWNIFIFENTINEIKKAQKIDRIYFLNIDIDFMKLCNLSPEFSNNLIKNYKEASHLIKNQIFISIKNQIYPLNLHLDFLIDLSEFFKIRLIPRNLPYLICLKNIRNFYLLAKNALNISNNKEIYGFKARIISFDQIKSIHSRIFKCSNLKYKCDSYCIKIKNDLYVSINNRIKKISNDENIVCSLCKSKFQEDHAWVSYKEKYFYYLINDNLIIKGFSTFKLQENFYYIFGLISRKYNGYPFLNILNFHCISSTEINERIRSNDFFEELSKRVFKNVSCFENAKKLMLILGFFNFKSSKIIIYCDDILSMERLCKMVFSFFKWKIPVIFEIKNAFNDSSFVILQKYKKKRNKLLNFDSFYIPNKKIIFDYSYEKNDIRRVFLKTFNSNFGDLLEENQDIFLRLRRHFKNKVKPSKILELMNDLLISLQFLSQKEIIKKEELILIGDLIEDTFLPN
ncbi:hypothetical protein LUQ84_001330 [Hamiltosporidium tvaerminnensis]|nr:hypothetical protein LUQ84_001330 [Hamiltosporidium tvaerminnensis]